MKELVLSVALLSAFGARAEEVVTDVLAEQKEKLAVDVEAQEAAVKSVSAVDVILEQNPTLHAWYANASDEDRADFALFCEDLAAQSFSGEELLVKYDDLFNRVKQASGISFFVQPHQVA